MNSRRLWGSHERHKFFRVSEMAFPEVFPTAETMLFRQNTRKTGNNVVAMSQAFHDIALFERFTDVNLEYAFNVIQN